MSSILLIVLIVVTLAAAYVVYIRPLLKARPALKEFYAQEKSISAAIRMKLAGMKQRLTAVLIVVAGVVVQAYDLIAPHLATAGIAPAQILPQVPAEAWPVIGIAIVLILGYFRKLSDDRAAEESKMEEE